MKKILEFFKSNSPVQNMFLFVAALAFISCILSSNFPAAIAWVCVFVLFRMFRGEQKQNRDLRNLLEIERNETLAIIKDLNKDLFKDKE